MVDVDELRMLGGHVAVDFVNSVEDRASDAPDDALRTPDDLRRWAERMRLLDPGSIPTWQDADVELADARQLREHMHAIFAATTESRAPRKDDLTALSVAAAEARATGWLKVTDDGRLSWQWDRRDLATVRRLVAECAIELLASRSTQRLRRCPGPGCGWFFLDTTKNANRRWCSMSGCGTRAKNDNRRRATQSDFGQRPPVLR